MLLRCKRLFSFCTSLVFSTLFSTVHTVPPEDTRPLQHCSAALSREITGTNRKHAVPLSPIHPRTCTGTCTHTDKHAHTKNNTDTWKELSISAEVSLSNTAAFPWAAEFLIYSLILSAVWCDVMRHLSKKSEMNAFSLESLDFFVKFKTGLRKELIFLFAKDVATLTHWHLTVLSFIAYSLKVSPVVLIFTIIWHTRCLLRSYTRMTFIVFVFLIWSLNKSKV